ncbi:toxin-antitoxin system YwqK family antitoxin [Cetobacterium ceti]
MEKKILFFLGLGLLMSSCENLQLTNEIKKEPIKEEKVAQGIDNNFVDAVIKVMNNDQREPKIQVEPEIQVDKNEGSDTIVEEKTAQPENIMTPKQIDDEHIIAEKVLKNTKEQDIVDKIQGKDKLIYLRGSKEPFTGTFVSFIGLHRVYSEDYVNGELNGEKIWYGEKGEIGLIEPYKDNKLNGIQKTYHLSNGKIRSEITYVDGKVNGPIVWYSEQGNIIDKEAIVNGTGTWVSYWSNGQLREKGQYKNYRRIGSWKRYLKNGELEKEVNYKNGRTVKREWLQ